MQWILLVEYRDRERYWTEGPEDVIRAIFHTWKKDIKSETGVGKKVIMLKTDRVIDISCR